MHSNNRTSILHTSLGNLCAKTLVLLILVCSLATHASDKKTMNIAFINPDNPSGQFWGTLSDYMRVAAKQFDINLTIYNANADRFQSIGIAKEIVRKVQKPDYLVMMYQVGVGKKILEIMRQYDIPVFIINTDIHPNDKPTLGLPRESFKNWIGHMSPNDFAAGQMLAKQLITDTVSEARIIALSGSRDTSAALNRNQGLYFSIQESHGSELTQLVFSEWNALNAGKQGIQLLSRYPDTNVIWAAGDCGDT